MSYGSHAVDVVFIFAHGELPTPANSPNLPDEWPIVVPETIPAHGNPSVAAYPSGVTFWYYGLPGQAHYNLAGAGEGSAPQCPGATQTVEGIRVVWRQH